jgi:predicted kinase
MKNILNIEITKPNQELIIMRGLPGSSKSTQAKLLVGENGSIHSTDTVIESFGDYSEHFKLMKETNDWSKHGKMHKLNLSNAIESMKEGKTPVVIDNTNLRLSESRPYIEAALEMGFNQNNIKIVDIGTGGKTLQELADRNTHNVDLETITRMNEIYKASGELTVKRIVETAGIKQSKILYSAIVLDKLSRSNLLIKLGNKIPKGWEVIAHHLTVAFGKSFPEELKDMLGKNVELTATHIGVSDLAIAVMVNGFPSEKETPHITLSVNRKEGGKPVDSNNINNWVKLEQEIKLNGIATEIYNR